MRALIKQHIYPFYRTCKKDRGQPSAPVMRDVLAGTPDHHIAVLAPEWGETGNTKEPHRTSRAGCGVVGPVGPRVLGEGVAQVSGSTDGEGNRNNLAANDMTDAHGCYLSVCRGGRD